MDRHAALAAVVEQWAAVGVVLGVNAARSLPAAASIELAELELVEDTLQIQSATHLASASLQPLLGRCPHVVLVPLRMNVQRLAPFPCLSFCGKPHSFVTKLGSVIRCYARRLLLGKKLRFRRPLPFHFSLIVLSSQLVELGFRPGKTVQVEARTSRIVRPFASAVVKTC